MRIVLVLLLISLSWVSACLGQCERTRLSRSAGNGSDWFSESFDVHGEFLAVGASRDSELGDQAGAATIYRRQGLTWVETQRILGSDTEAGDRFGTAVSIDENVLAIGSYRDDGHGSVYLYDWDGSGFVESTKILSPVQVGNEKFGREVVLHGEWLFVGMEHDDTQCGGDVLCDSGAVWVYRKEGVEWKETGRLLASDGDAHDHFGNPMDVSEDTLIIGAFKHRQDAGAAYVFQLDGSIWREQAKLLPADGNAFDNFGFDVAIDGDVALIGARGRDVACPHNPVCDSGAAYVYRRQGSVWVEEATLTPSDPQEGANFGWSTDLEGGRLLVGAPLWSGAEVYQGAAYSFEWSNGAWIEGPRWRSQASAMGDGFGAEVHVELNEAFIGAPQVDSLSTSAGALSVWSLHEGDSSNYGQGHPGRDGIVPILTLAAPPKLGEVLTLWGGNSSGVDTTGVLMVGLEEGEIETDLEGVLLVQPIWAWPLIVRASGLEVVWRLPGECEWSGLALYAQLLQWDEAASRGVSFSPGLALTLGA